MSENAENELIRRFNDRDAEAFGELYRKLYSTLYYFARTLYKSSSENAEDAVQDAFLRIWEHAEVKFESMAKIKSYLYLTIRNDFISHVRHAKIVESNKDSYLYEKDYYVYRAAEAEIFTVLPEALGLLPEECAHILSMLLEGYTLKEVSEKTGMPVSTVHHKKDQAIAILKEKVGKDLLSVLLMLSA